MMVVVEEEMERNGEKRDCMGAFYSSSKFEVMRMNVVLNNDRIAKMVSGKYSNIDNDIVSKRSAALAYPLRFR